MHIYEQRRLDNEYRRRKRYESVIKKIPEIKALDDSISTLSVQQGRRLLEGDDLALSSLKEKLHELSQKRQLF